MGGQPVIHKLVFQHETVISPHLTESLLQKMTVVLETHFYSECCLSKRAQDLSDRIYHSEYYHDTQTDYMHAIKEYSKHTCFFSLSYEIKRSNTLQLWCFISSSFHVDVILQDHTSSPLPL